MAETVYYVRNRKIEICCPQCRSSKAVPAEKFLALRKNVKLRLKCPCGHVHDAFLERRAHHRKVTLLEGRYVCLTDKCVHFEGNILISDLSVDGIGFIMLKPPSTTPLPGDSLAVQFKINELPGALFKKDVKVRSFKGDRIGARFLEQITYATDKPLKIFLMS